MHRSFALKRNMRIFLILFVSLVLSGCLEDNNQTSARENARIAMGKMGGGVASIAPAPADASYVPPVSQSPSSMALDRSKFGDRKIAETHTLGIEVLSKQLGLRYQRDLAKCVELNCVIGNSTLNSDSSAYIQATIPPDNLRAFLDFLGEGEGEIKTHQVSADDQTFQYMDTDARLKNQQALRERLLALLQSDETKTVDNVLQIERELARVQGEIDSATSQMRFLEKQTSNATIYINYNVAYQPVEFTSNDLKNSFMYAWRAFLSNVDRIIRFVGAILPWIPIFFLGFWVLVRIVRFAFGKVGWSWKSITFRKKTNVS